MSVNFIEFAQTVNDAVPVLEAEFEKKATQLIAKFNVQSSIPYVPVTDPYMYGGRYTSQLNAAANKLALAPVEPATVRDTSFTNFDDQNAYLGAVKAAKGFYDKWFGTPTADQLMNEAYTNLINGNVKGLIDEYIEINKQEALEIRTLAQIKYNRDEDALLVGAAKYMTPRMPGPIYRDIGLLKEQMHESIREQLMKLGGEGLQRDYQLVLANITERLSLNNQAKQAMGGWINSIDNPLYAAKTLKDNQKSDADILKASQLMDLSARIQSFDRQGLALANERLAAVREATFAPAFGQHDINKGELNYLIQDLSTLGTHLAGTYNRIRGSFGMSWGSSTSQSINRTTST